MPPSLVDVPAAVEPAVVPASRPAPFARVVPWVLLLGGLVGCTAAVVLTVEKVALLTNPDYVPSCSINPVLSCGSIMSAPQAEAFGFPNPILGIVGFAVVTTTGAALLAGARLARWYWIGLQIGVLAGAVFVGWLVFQSLYRIGALCPYCMAVWAVVLPVAVYVTLHNLTAGTIRVPARGRRLVDVLVRYHGVILTSLFLVLAGLIAQAFWSSWLVMAGIGAP